MAKTRDLSAYLAFDPHRTLPESSRSGMQMRAGAAQSIDAREWVAKR
jgi:hypothetical protein